VTPPLAFREGAEFGFGLLYLVDLDHDHAVNIDLFCFIGILIEQHAGALPVWLAPQQVSVLNITDEQADYAESVVKTLQKQGVRAASDLRNHKITYKIREHSMQKVPFILVVGDKEKTNGAVSVRARGNQDLGVMSLEAFSQKALEDIRRKA